MAKQQKQEVHIGAYDKSGAEVDVSFLETSGVAFDPTTVHLDLTKEEKRRTTALLLAIQAYQNIIIKDAEMYDAISRDASREGPKIKPATMEAMVSAALDFDDFISGKLQARIDAEESKPESPDATDATALP